MMPLLERLLGSLHGYYSAGKGKGHETTSTVARPTDVSIVSPSAGLGSHIRSFDQDWSIALLS